jgi:SWI/SNF-related matrix-associated actin-dependent regulator 1 of chromatin subfamily A
MNNTITVVDGEYHIKFQYAAHLINAIKTIPGRRFNGETKAWVVPMDASDYVMSFANQFGFAVEQATPEPQVDFTIPALPELTTQIELKRKLFPYQTNGVAYALEKKRVIVGDEPGLGKTGQAIATIMAANQFPCLVICPASLKINWQREWELWTNKKARVIDPAIARYMDRWIDAGMIDVFIINYESLKKYFVQSINKPEGKKLTIKDIVFNKKKDLFKSVIVDESHRCKDIGTQQTKFVRGIAKDKEWCLLLTGTPVVNKPKDLVAQLGIMGRMEDFGNYKYFVQRYCGGNNGASNLKELNYKLNTTCFYRRAKSDVLKDLPAKMRQVVVCEIDDKHRMEYNKAEADLKEYLVKFKQADDEKVERALRGEVMVRIGILKNISARGKLKDVRDYIQDTLDSGEKLVVFLHLKEVFYSLFSMFPNAVSIVGDNTSDERQKAVDSFQNDPNCKLILCSMQAAGVGLTLTASSRVAFVEQGWHPAMHDQCEDRCHRIGQQDSVQCTYFLGKDTIDEWVYQIIQDKRKITNEITGAEDDVSVDIVDKFASLFNINTKEQQGV